MKIPKALVTASGALLLLSTWQYAGSVHLLGRTLPAPSDVFAIYRQDFRFALLARSARATVGAAAIGLSCGTLLGVAVAMLAHLVPALREGFNRLAVLVNALPVIVLGPILILCAGRRATPAALATVPVFFLMYMAASTGLKHVAYARLAQYLRSLGSSRMQTLLQLEIPSSIPNLVTGLKTSIGSAMIGAIVGEWFGAPRGLGVVVINAMQNFQIALMWAAVLVIAAISLLSFLLLGVLERAAERRLR
jgi:ABC-type nitrate/sulfonate/bicarbonate transport system, permease component